MRAAASQLVPFQGKNGYTVLMPPNPQTNDRTQDTPGGQVQVHIAQAQDPAGKYLSTLSEFPKGSLDKIKSKDLLDSLQQATIQSMGGTLVNAQDVEVAGLPGREFTATDPEGSAVTARVFVGGSHVYTLAGTYPQGQQVPGSIQQFGSSSRPPAAQWAAAVRGRRERQRWHRELQHSGCGERHGGRGVAGLDRDQHAAGRPRRARSTAAGLEHLEHLRVEQRRHGLGQPLGFSAVDVRRRDQSPPDGRSTSSCVQASGPCACRYAQASAIASGEMSRSAGKPAPRVRSEAMGPSMGT